MAQERFRMGVTAGLNGTQVSGDELAGFDKLGAFGGVFVNRQLNEIWSAELAIVYSQKGSRKIADPENGDLFSYDLKLDYIEIPVTFRYGHQDFQFEVGPSFGTLISWSEENQNGPVQANRDFKEFEVGMNLGVIYNFSPNFGVNFRFNNSVLPIRPHASGATFRLNFGQYNTVLTLALRGSF